MGSCVDASASLDWDALASLRRAGDRLGVTALLSHMIEMPSHDREAGVVMAA
jgi:hypothetical protein